MATLQQLEQALVAADKAGDSDAARKLAAVIGRARMDASNSIPQTVVAETVAAPQTYGVVDSAIGGAETALSLATGATGGAAGMLGGTLKGLAEQILSGKFGTQEARRLVEQSALEGARALTYAPRTQAGQEMAQATGETLSRVIPPVIPIIGTPGAVMASMRAAKPTVQALAASTGGMAGQATKQAGQAIGQATGRAIGGVRDAFSGSPEKIPGIDDVPTVKSAGRAVGAQATDLELQRATEADIAGLRLTEGETKRSPQMLAWEKEKAKTPEFQAQFLERQRENNIAAVRKLEQVLDDTGAETGDLSGTGIKVVDALMGGWKEEKAKTRRLYEAFRASPESQSVVDATPVVSFLNDQPKGVAGVTGVTDTARQNAIRLGIASDVDGALAPNPSATLGMLEDFRQSISAIGAASPNDKRLASILKSSIDSIGDPIGGEITGAMRAQRRNQAAKYENRAIVSRLLLEKRGMSDPQVPIEDVFNKTILNSRPSEIRHIKRVLLSNDTPESKQAWAELRGATVRHLISEAEAGIGADNLPVISGAKLNKALTAMDKNGKLDMVLGKPQAEQLRNLNQVLQYIQSVPPGTSINNSGTARTILSLMAETGAMQVTTGIPLPIVQGMKALKDSIRDKRIKARIAQALNYKPQEQ